MSDTQLETEQPSTSLDEIETIKKQLANERQARQSAERERDEVRRSNTETVQRLQVETDTRFKAQEEQVETALAAYEGQVKTLREQYQAALDAGQTAKAAEINDAMIEARMNIQNAKNYKAWVENQKAQVKAQPVQPQQPVYTARTQAWIDAHPQYNTDNKFRMKCQAADADAVAEGIERDTPEYFAHVERFVGLAKAEPAAREETAEEEIVVEPTPAPQRKVTTVSTAAPVSRTGMSLTGDKPSNRNNFKLSSDEAEIARISFPTEYREDPKKAYQKYWENKQDLIREGRIAN